MQFIAKAPEVGTEALREKCDYRIGLLLLVAYPFQELCALFHKIGALRHSMREG